MKRTLGQEVIDVLDARAKKVEQFDRMQLLMMVTEYKPKVDALLAGKREKIDGTNLEETIQAILE